jgi:uncharacterized membrane protein YphA (DoxX/SURF4 family)
VRLKATGGEVPPPPPVAFSCEDVQGQRLTGTKEGLGLPLPTFFGVVVMLVELIGGIVLLIGLVWEVTPRRG